MTVPERLEALRKRMEEKKIDVYVVPTADFHQSEYVGEHFKARKFITGFSGSAGTAVITKTEARLWTDGRYFIPGCKAAGGIYSGTDEDGRTRCTGDECLHRGSITGWRNTWI